MSGLPRLHVVTDDAVLASHGFPERARVVLEAGGADLALHVRGPGTGGRRLYDLASALTDAARGAGALLVVNDRVDVALATGAEGVHLGERSLGPAEVRTLLPDGVVVGASVHGVGGARQAVQEGAEYLIVGTIYRSASHPGRPGAGTERIVEVVGAVPCPVVAIGGIGPGRVHPVLKAGAHGVAVLSAVWRAGDAGAATAELLAELGPAGPDGSW